MARAGVAAVNYKINGRSVSQEEWDEHHAKREALYGNLLDDMLASRRAPMMGNSDRMFMEGANAQTCTHGLDELSVERSLSRAHGAGVSTHGKVYMSQLGTPENPLAWVSGIEDLRTSLRIQGKGCESLGIKPVVKDPGPDVPLAEDIIEEEIAERLMANPDLQAKLIEKPETLNELKEQVIEKHGPQKK
jgi:hypothetical protein